MHDTIEHHIEKINGSIFYSTYLYFVDIEHDLFPIPAYSGNKYLKHFPSISIANF